MHIFKEYDDYGVEDELFHFVAAGNNRDGLALRAASHLMVPFFISRLIFISILTLLYSRTIYSPSAFFHVLYTAVALTSALVLTYEYPILLSPIP